MRTVAQAVEDYVTASASRSDLDRTSVGKGKKKTGTDTGAVVVHPISGEKVWRDDDLNFVCEVKGYVPNAVLVHSGHLG